MVMNGNKRTRYISFLQLRMKKWTKMFKDLDPLLHSQLRLAMMSLLVSEEKADFSRIKEITQATSGNISVQIGKLEAAGYISVTKSFKDNYPNTELALTPKGLQAFESYVEALKGYISNSNEQKWKRNYKKH